MSDILHLSFDDSSIRTLRLPEAVLDPATAAVVAREVAAARAVAFAEGEASGRAQALADVERATDAVEAVLRTLHAEVMEQRELATAASLDLARAAATAVIDRSPPMEALELLEQVRSVTRILDAEDLTVKVNPSDHAILTSLPAVAGLQWIADETLAAGDVRIDGARCGADLRRETLLAAALEALGEAAR